MTEDLKNDGETMRTLLILACLFITMLAAGCAPGGTGIILECTPPLIQKGDGCCMDADQNGVCDADEAKPAEEKEEAEQEPEAEKEEEPKEEPKAEELSAPKNTQEEAEKVGKVFADNLESKQYNVMYALFVPSLKQKKTATEFTAIMELDPFYKKIKTVDFEGVQIIEENKAELSITAHTKVQDIEIPRAMLEFIDGAWRVNVFADVFDLDTYDAACSGYRYNNQYTMEDCAFDFAKKVKDHSYCEISECHYVECLKALGKPSGMMQEAEQCYFCQPTGKTVNQCILDIAIKYDKVSPCNIIDEEHYSDKYCTCYGGFAKYKGNSGYCNMIPNPDHKDLCIKSYNDEYC